MPYIPDVDAQATRNLLRAGVLKPKDAGQLNFVLHHLLFDYLSRKGLSYQHINDIVGVLQQVQVEFNRRVVAPYEDKKIAENGDVYPEWLLEHANVHVADATGS